MTDFIPIFVLPERTEGGRMPQSQSMTPLCVIGTIGKNQCVNEVILFLG